MPPGHEWDEMMLRISLVGLIIFSVSSCTSSSSVRAPQSDSSTTVNPSLRSATPGATATATAATASVPNGEVALAVDHDNGRSLTLARGQHLRVVLASTYWQFRAASDSSVLAVAEPPRSSPTKPCVPGGGCGTVDIVYAAAKAGTAVVIATRTSCGEAVGCTAGSGTFTLTVQVK